VRKREQEIDSPKQAQSPTRREWYPYYAGYRTSFAADVFAHHMPHAVNIVDPWNGSGTTTAAASRLGVSSVGVDLNPAMTVIARGRQAPRSIGESIQPLARELAKVGADIASHGHAVTPESDLLLSWFSAETARSIGSIKNAIDRTLTNSDEVSADAVDTLPILPAFYYTALFAAVRGFLKLHAPKESYSSFRSVTWKLLLSTLCPISR
jgi:hypothetical protein